MTQEEFDNAIDSYINNIASKNNTPPWFALQTKADGSRNITIDTWNEVITCLKNMASDVNSDVTVVKAIVDFLSTAFITSSRIADDAVTTYKIADTAVTFDKLYTDVKNYIDRAVQTITYDEKNNILKYKSNSNTIVTIQLPSIIKNVSYDDSAKTIIFTFNNDSTYSISTSDFLPIWASSLSDSTVDTVPPEAKAVVDYIKEKVDEQQTYTDEQVETRVEKLPHIGSTYPGVYANQNDTTVLIRVDYTPNKNTLVLRDNGGHINVIKTPTAPTHPVSKHYFDEVENNFLKPAFDKLTRRMENLESASSGKTYVPAKSTFGYGVNIQNPLPYGILSQLGSSRVSYKNAQSKIYHNGDSWTIPDEIKNGTPFVTFSEGAGIFMFKADGDELMCINGRLTSGRDYEMFNAYGDGIMYWGNDMICTPNPVTSVEYGLPYDYENNYLYWKPEGENNPVFDPEYRADTLSDKNGLVIPKATEQGVFIRCSIPKGATVTVNVDYSTTGNSVMKSYVIYNESRTLRTTDAVLRSSVTLKHKDVGAEFEGAWILIYKSGASTPFDADVELTNLRIDFEEPFTCPFAKVLFKKDVPQRGEFGIGLDADVFNYYDLTKNQFVEHCEIVNNEAVVLESPVVYECPELAEASLEVLNLSTTNPFGILRFNNEANLPVPHILDYQSKI